MSRLQEGKTFLMTALAALFALACFAFQPSDAMADPGAGLKMGNMKSIEHMVADNYARTPLTLNNAQPGPGGPGVGPGPGGPGPGPAPRAGGPGPGFHPGPANPPPPPHPTYVGPTHYYVDDGGVGMTVSGAILSAAGLALGAMAIFMPDAEYEGDNTGLTNDERIGIGITGGAVLIVGVALLGVGGYRIHKSNSVAIDVAPAFGGATMHMTF